MASERPWRAEFVSYVHNHVSGLRLRILREPGAAFAPDVDTVVADDSSTLLVPRAVRELQDKGKRVIGIFDDEDEGAGEALLEQLEVDLRVPADVAADELARLVVALGPAERLDAELEEFLGAGTRTRDVEPEAPRAITVAVGGPAGAGATEIALGLAGALARRKARVLAIDLDVAYPGLARRLRFGLDSNLLSTLDALAYDNRPLTSALATRIDGAPGIVPFDAVGGLANPADWIDVSDGEVATLLDDAQAWPYVVVDVGAAIEDLEVDGRDRFGAPRTAVARADVVIAVAEASRMGILRLFDWAANAHEVAPYRAFTVVLNHAPCAAVRRRQLSLEITEALGPLLDELVFVSADGAVTAAAWDGRPVARSRFTRSLHSLAAAVPAPVAATGTTSTVGAGA